MSRSDAPSPARVTFEDALGTRVHLQPAAGGAALDLLWFDERVAAVPSFEFALRERVGSFEQFRDAHFATIKGVDRSASTRMRLVLITDHAPGIRLAQLIAETERRQLHLDVATVLSIMRHLAAAIAMLHEHAPGMAHGAICPGRIVIAPNGRLVVLEHVLGSALEQLRYSPARYWEELGIALPSATRARIDQCTDVFQTGAVLLSLLLGRSLDRTCDPGRLKYLIPTAMNRADLQRFSALRLGLDAWLERALQVNAGQGFASGLDAWSAFDEVLGRGRMPVPAAIEIPIAPGITASHPVSDAEPRAGTPPQWTREHTPRGPAPARWTRAAAHEPSPVDVRPATRERPGLTVPPATGLALRSAPEPLTPRPFHSSTALSLRPTLLDMAPAPAPVDEAEDIAYTFANSRELAPGSWRQLAGVAVAVAVCVVGAAAFYAGHHRPVADGTITLTTNPAGARAVVDGTARGVTPLTLTLAAGKHMVELRDGGASRTLPLTIASGADVSQYVELPPRPSQRGELEVRTDPSGARISVDDVPVGESPMRVDLGAGKHRIMVERNGTKVAQDVTIQPATTASLLVPLAPRSTAPQFGWLSIKAPVDVQVYEHGQLLGTSQSPRLMMAAGAHDIDLVNDVLAYRAARTLQIAPGQVTPLQVDFPLGSVDLSTTPPADAWVDGQRVGATPIDNLPVPIGPHEILFRNTQLGDRHYAVTVTAAKPVRLDIDLTK